MEKEMKMKRAREEEEQEGEDDESKNKRINLHEKKNKEVLVEEEQEDENGCSSSQLGHGVFDFPWLKEEGNSFLDCGEDTFFFFSSSSSSSLKGKQDLESFDSFKLGVVDDFSEESGFCCENTTMAHHVPEDKLVEDLWKPFEDVDCGIWSSLLNQPL